MDLLSTDIDDKRRLQLIRRSAPVLQVMTMAQWVKTRGPNLLHQFEDQEVRK